MSPAASSFPELRVDYPLKTVSQLRPLLLGFRKKSGLTQEKLAQRLGISQQSYAAFEANPAAASVERLFRVLRLLSVDMRLLSTEADLAPAPRAVAARKSTTSAKTPKAKPKAAAPTQRPSAPANTRGTKRTTAAKTATKSAKTAKAPQAAKATKTARKKPAPRKTQAAASPRKREDW
jgi:HTH-type transcriptional regulator / antitoxin HipB